MKQNRLSRRIAARYETIVGRQVAVVFLLLLVAALASAGDLTSTGQTTDVEQEVRLAHQSLCEAATRGDATTVSNLIADDATWVDANGSIVGKRRLLATVPVSLHGGDVDRIRPVGTQVVITGTGRFGGAADVRFFEEWAAVAGRWRLEAHQEVPLAMPSTTPVSRPTGTSGTLENRAPTSDERGVEPALDSAGERAVWNVVTALERAFLKGDAIAYSRLTSDGYVRIAPEGEQRKYDFLQAVRKNRGQSPGALSSQDVHIRVDGDMASVSEETSGHLAGGEPVPPTRVRLVFEKRNDRWRQVIAVFTPIAEK